MDLPGLPPKQGLYDPQYEKDRAASASSSTSRARDRTTLSGKGFKSLKILPIEGRKVAILAPEMAPEFCSKCLTNF